MSSTESQPNPPDRSSPAPALAKELEMLAEMAQSILDAANSLVPVLEGRRPVDEGWEAIRELEHKADAIARDLFEALIPARAAPGSDREALKALTGYLDDVLDAIEAAAARLAIHRVRRAISQARAMGGLVQECAQELVVAVGAIRRMQDVFPHTRALHRLENRGDDVLRETIEALFSGRTSAKEIIKWKDICETLEAATDRCEDVANVLETMLVQSGAPEVLGAGRIVLDVERHEAAVAGRPIPLTAKEFALLHLLLRHQGKVVRRERLLREVWGDDYFGDSRTLDTHVGWLRKKVEASGGVRLVAVRGIGYRLDLTQ
jgi:DNA-binding response OmpR family regulator